MESSKEYEESIVQTEDIYYMFQDIGAIKRNLFLIFGMTLTFDLEMNLKAKGQ